MAKPASEKCFPFAPRRVLISLPPVRPPRLPFFASLVLLAPAGAAPFDDRVEALFRPPLGEMMALSPDGQRIAYTAQVGRDLTIVMMSVEPPGPKQKISADLSRDAAPPPADHLPLPLRFMRWATDTRLVFAPVERIVPLPPVPDKSGRLAPNPDGPTIVSPIFAVDADGRQRGALIDARDFQETPAEARRTMADLLRTTQELQATRNESVHWRMPHLDMLGFLPNDREQLVFQTHGAYNIPAQHLVDIRTGNVREFGGDWPAPPGDPHVFDWYRLKLVGEHVDAIHPATSWRDPELAKVQQELASKFPHRIVEILDWSETRARVLLRVTGGSDAGRVFVYQRPEDLVLAVLHRRPWLQAAKLNQTRFFEFDAPDGVHLSGYVTWPAQPRLNPPPLLVVFPSGFPGHAQRAFDPEAQVFADLGFVVARLNHRCVAGVRNADLNVLRAGVDRVAVDDALKAIEWIARSNADRVFDRKRVATLGHGFGGYLAVRALQLEPAAFRCGLAFDAPMDLRMWLRSEEAAHGGRKKNRSDIPVALIDHQAADWMKLSVIDQADALTNPVFLLFEPKRNTAIDASGSELRARLQGLGRPADFLELDPAFAAAPPETHAAVYRRAEEFLNLRLYDFAVKIGPTEEVR